MLEAAGSRRDRVTSLLVAATLGVYLLIAAGITAALSDAVAACPTWPLCGVHPFAALDDLALALAMGHRAAALVVAVVLLAAVWAVWRDGAGRRVRLSITIAAALYPVQVGVGAWTVLAGGTDWLSAVHLVTAMALFSTLLVALLWQLEAAAPTDASAHEASSDPALSPSADSTAGLFGTLRAYLTLTKPKLWWLLSLVALAAMALAAGPALDLGVVVTTISSGVLAIAASGTFNNVLERDRDRRMARTRNRPLVEDAIPVWRAVAFGVLLTVASVAVFLAHVNILAAALGLLAILFYAVVYTLVLKPHTDQNTVLGGAAGAFPALIGWAAVEQTIALEAVVLATVIFLWTPAHFYNLALVYRQDYERADFPMLPVVRGAATTRRHVLLYLGATMLSAVLLGAITRLDWLYAATAVVVGAIFLWTVVRQFAQRTDRAAARTFVASNVYLGLLLVAVLVDAIAI
jgi:protoheme IX farnesyltransferase